MPLLNYVKVFFIASKFLHLHVFYFPNTKIFHMQSVRRFVKYLYDMLRLLAAVVDYSLK